MTSFYYFICLPRRKHITLGVIAFLFIKSVFSTLIVNIYFLVIKFSIKLHKLVINQLQNHILTTLTYLFTC